MIEMERDRIWRMFEDRFLLTGPRGTMARIRQLSVKGQLHRTEGSMVCRQNISSQSEHDLFIRLFLTGGGGW